MKTATKLWQDIRECVVRPGTLTVWWLYQARLVVKTPGGMIAAIDPYLSDAVALTYGLTRAVPAPLDAAEAEVDLLLATHSHEDHLDPDSVRGFLGHQNTKFVGPPMAAEKVLGTGVGEDRVVRMRRGDVLEFGDLSVRAVHARHLFAPEPTPDAVGYVLAVGGLSLYHTAAFGRNQTGRVS